MPPQHFDTIVIGSGLAGLTFALDAAKQGPIIVLTKAQLWESNTSYAQGGIAAAVGESDSWQLHEQDTLIAGAGLCDPAAVRFLVQEAPAAIEWLASLGAQFDKETDLTDWALGMEGGHSRNRIVHHADRTGWEVERAMNEAVRKEPNITILENAFVTDLLMQDGRCIGCAMQDRDLGIRTFTSRAVILATGGAGRLYQHTTNPRIATADGVALAARVGAAIQDMEFMQFHPTTLYHPQMRSFLITEAARGEGGTLRSHQGTRFMYDYDERLELAPRDIVARAIDAEMKKLQTWCVYLDMTHLARSHIERHFPTIVERLKGVGLEPHKNWIPVVPAQHYSCGGVVTDLNGRTSIPGLFAAGEVARTGVHGANRLASNSLLEALVFAKAAASALSGESVPEIKPTGPGNRHSILEADALRIRRSLEKTMTEHVGIVRHNRGLAQASARVAELTKEYNDLPEAPPDVYAIEAENLLIAAKTVIDGAIARQVNVGLHYNADLDSASGHQPKTSIAPK
ncbi:MAG: L-aspartate oxidase [Fimbriimonadaceae bacterium]|nr:L-aspartate oxidase [Fimbriimonadaceae bacterium]